MARPKKLQEEVEQSTPLDIQEQTIATSDNDGVDFSENIVEYTNVSKEQSEVGVKVIINHKGFTKEPQIISESVLEILKSKGIKIELC